MGRYWTHYVLTVQQCTKISRSICDLTILTCPLPAQWSNLFYDYYVLTVQQCTKISRSISALTILTCSIPAQWCNILQASCLCNIFILARQNRNAFSSLHFSLCNEKKNVLCWFNLATSKHLANEEVRNRLKRADKDSDTWAYTINILRSQFTIVMTVRSNYDTSKG
jgi:hypothetical protein